MTHGHPRGVRTVTAAAAFLLPVLAQAADTAQPVMARGTLVQTLVGLLAVVVLILGLAWMLRQVFRLQPTMHGQMRVLGGLSLGPRERVVLIKVGDTQLVVGTTPGRIQTLHVLETPLPEGPAGADGSGGGFAHQLRQALGGARTPRGGRG